MRRSAAPSQIAAKRGRFVPPFRALSSSNSQFQVSSDTCKQDTSVNIIKNDSKIKFSSSESSNSSILCKRNVLSLIQGRCENGTKVEDPQHHSLHETNGEDNEMIKTGIVSSAGDTGVLKENNGVSCFTRNIVGDKRNLGDGSNCVGSESFESVENPSDRPVEVNVARKTLSVKRSFKAPVQQKGACGNLSVCTTDDVEGKANYFSVMW